MGKRKKPAVKVNLQVDIEEEHNTDRSRMGKRKKAAVKVNLPVDIEEHNTDRLRRMGERKKPVVRVNLPVDIEENILSRLPVKTIVRFRSVCKSWNTLVLNPCFINLHQNNKPVNNNNLLIVLLHKSKDIVVVDTASVVHSRLQVGRVRDDCKKIVGSCDGIVCVNSACYDYDDDMFRDYTILWNPALRIIKCIDNRVGCRHVLEAQVGFGFHNQSNDYKVLRFETRPSNSITIDNYPYTITVEQVEIYSLSSGSWRTIKAALPPRMINTSYFYMGPHSSRASGVYVNGAHHWSVQRIENVSPYNIEYHSAIISFDMGDEVFKEIMLPTECLLQGVFLFNYKDSLSMLTVADFMDKLCDIWVMKEYGELSWTKLCKVDMPPQLVRPYIVGMGIIDQEDNELVLKSAGNIHGHDQQKPVVFDIDNLQMKDTASCSTANIEILKHAIHATTFTESLLLIN